MSLHHGMQGDDEERRHSGSNGLVVAGHIEYWSPSTFSFTDGTAFKSKLDTDLYALAKAKAAALSLDVSRDGSQFVIFSSDRFAAMHSLRHAQHRGIVKPGPPGTASAA